MSHHQTSERFAILMLLVACAFWGMSFNWNKEAQEFLGTRWTAVTGDSAAAHHGPATFLALRFPIAAILWFVLFSHARGRWSRGILKGGLAGGLLLSSGMLLQHYGLALTSESLSAFLTSLTILFTPIAAAVLLRHRIPASLWMAVIIATVGVALMTIFREEGRFELGAMLGLLCAVVFSGHILVVDHFGKKEDPWRFTFAQLVVASAVFTTYLLFRCGWQASEIPRVVAGALENARFIAATAAAVVFATLVTFGLMFRYQPMTTPTRAALAYLTEPLFATLYAWIVAGKGIDGGAIVGGVLILLGNVLAEILGKRQSNCDIFVAPSATASDR